MKQSTNTLYILIIIIGLSIIVNVLVGSTNESFAVKKNTNKVATRGTSKIASRGGSHSKISTRGAPKVTTRGAPKVATRGGAYPKVNQALSTGTVATTAIAAVNAAAVAKNLPPGPAKIAAEAKAAQLQNQVVAAIAPPPTTQLQNQVVAAIAPPTTQLQIVASPASIDHALDRTNQLAVAAGKLNANNKHTQQRTNSAALALNQHSQNEAILAKNIKALKGAVSGPQPSVMHLADRSNKSVQALNKHNQNEATLASHIKNLKNNVTQLQYASSGVNPAIQGTISGLQNQVSSLQYSSSGVNPAVQSTLAGLQSQIADLNVFKSTYGPAVASYMLHPNTTMVSTSPSGAWTLAFLRKSLNTPDATITVYNPPPDNNISQEVFTGGAKDPGEAIFNSMCSGKTIFLRRVYDNNGNVRADLDFYYKRLTPLPEGFSYYFLLTDTWVGKESNGTISKNNFPGGKTGKITGDANQDGKDFVLYKTLADAQNNNVSTKITGCNFNDNNVGPFRDCDNRGGIWYGKQRGGGNNGNNAIWIFNQ